jgi:KipI family sensor histidine kinase inhibitor
LFAAKRILQDRCSNEFQGMSDLRIEFLGDSAVLLNFGERIDAELNLRVHALADVLRDADLPGLIDVVPAYASIAVHYDLRVWHAVRADETAAQRLSTCLANIVDKYIFIRKANSLPRIDIPVCYGADFGPDLADLAKHAQLDEQDVIARHSAADYRVAMLGFAPGFPYLLGLDANLRAPRRANPRTRVPAGSVAIGAAQTGIYPRELPGGWQIIGRTPLVLFDPTKESPALLSPGQQIRFHEIDAHEFARLRRHPTA